MMTQNAKTDRPEITRQCNTRAAAIILKFSFNEIAILVLGL